MVIKTPRAAKAARDKATKDAKMSDLPDAEPEATSEPVEDVTKAVDAAVSDDGGFISCSLEAFRAGGKTFNPGDPIDGLSDADMRSLRNMKRISDDPAIKTEVAARLKRASKAKK